MNISPLIAKRFIEVSSLSCLPQKVLSSSHHCLQETQLLLCCFQALKAENVDFIVAPYEADAQMAFLAQTNRVDIVLTEDSDLLAYGCPTVSQPPITTHSNFSHCCSLWHGTNPIQFQGGLRWATYELVGGMRDCEETLIRSRTCASNIELGRDRLWGNCRYSSKWTRQARARRSDSQTSPATEASALPDSPSKCFWRSVYQLNGCLFARKLPLTHYNVL